MTKVDAPVSVILSFDHKKRKVFPQEISWQGKAYPVTKIGLHHTYRRGRTLYHVFSVAAEGLFCRLVLDTETLFWRLEEVVDPEQILG